MSSYAIPTLLSVCCLTAAGFAAAAEPKRDVKYDTKHERKVLDFWSALKEGEPAPDFVFFHGGGFHNGDKSHLEKYLKPALYAHRKAGFALVSCNYPFLADGMDYPDIANHCAQAVQFVRAQSKEWNIDPKRLVCGGVSAGALISEFLGYHHDFAAPKAEHPRNRQSSRPAVVVSIMQPIGTKEFALRSMDKGETPLFLYSDAAPDDRIHPPWAVSLASPAPRMAANTTIFPRSRMAGGATGVLSQASHQLRKVSN